MGEFIFQVMDGRQVVIIRRLGVAFHAKISLEAPLNGTGEVVGKKGAILSEQGAQPLAGIKSIKGVIIRNGGAEVVKSAAELEDGI
jgi:hypothetical protein